MKKQFGGVLLYGYFGLLLVVTLSLRAYWYRYKATPEQPIAFSHKIHVSKVGLKCLFCHQGTDRSTLATVPPVSKCMSCHKAVKVDSPEIKKLTKYWNDRQPVPWAQIHKLPDFVYFSHKRHIRRGVECQTCHGQVQAMDRVRKMRSLSMGFCVACHRLRGASIDCYTCHK